MNRKWDDQEIFETTQYSLPITERWIDWIIKLIGFLFALISIAAVYGASVPSWFKIPVIIISVIGVICFILNLRIFKEKNR